MWICLHIECCTCFDLRQATLRLTHRRCPGTVQRCASGASHATKWAAVRTRESQCWKSYRAQRVPTAAAGTYDGDALPRLRCDVDPLQHLPLRVVAEVHILQTRMTSTAFHSGKLYQQEKRIVCFAPQHLPLWAAAEVHILQMRISQAPVGWPSTPRRNRRMPSPADFRGLDWT